MSALFVLSLAFTSASCSSHFPSYKALGELPNSAPADLAELERLRKAGVDLSKPLRIDFFFYVPTRMDAERSAKALLHDGFAVKVEQGDPKEAEVCHWLVLATAEHVASVKYLKDSRGEFQGLSRIHGGIYSGWMASAAHSGL